MDDRVVWSVFGSIHAWSKEGTVKRRATNQMTVQAHQTRTSDSVGRTVHDVARPRSLAQEGVVGGGAVPGEGRGDGEHAREGVQHGRTAAAVGRAAKGKAPARSLASPRERVVDLNKGDLPPHYPNYECSILLGHGAVSRKSFWIVASVDFF